MIPMNRDRFRKLIVCRLVVDLDPIIDLLNTRSDINLITGSFSFIYSKFIRIQLAELLIWVS